MGESMIEQNHINWYWEDILRAKSIALDEIAKARSIAKQALCGGCNYCCNTARHEQVLEQSVEGLMILIGTLSPGQRSSMVFPKIMNHEINIYRAFITDTGEYVPIYRGTDHSDYRKRYAGEHGEEKAYRMINVHGSGMKTKILFCDRKAPPNQAQLSTLRELMIDAEGALTFRFELDTNHPR